MEAPEALEAPDETAAAVEGNQGPTIGNSPTPDGMIGARRVAVGAMDMRCATVSHIAAYTRQWLPTRMNHMKLS